MSEAYFIGLPFSALRVPPMALSSLFGPGIAAVKFGQVQGIAIGMHQAVQVGTHQRMMQPTKTASPAAPVERPHTDVRA